VVTKREALVVVFLKTMRNVDVKPLTGQSLHHTAQTAV